MKKDDHDGKGSYIIVLYLESKKSYHWHIDYLDPAVKEVWVSGYGERLEHEWAGLLGEIASEKIIGFGCSDCSCESHLFYFKSFRILQNFQKVLFKKNMLLLGFD
jgi:Uri superfamily endonuclease